MISVRKTSISPMGSMSIRASRISEAVALTGKTAVVTFLNEIVRPPPREASAWDDARREICCSGKEKLTGAEPSCTTSSDDETSPCKPLTSSPRGGRLPRLRGDATSSP
jgi:hypothetical protein